ncbi:alpha/beta hydrolase [Rhizobium sp.]|uniref:alpha/beta hydrolase family protein n=1 Tax=Rhizobium sp. TaxID=391 RepID=UPI002AA7EE77
MFEVGFTTGKVEDSGRSNWDGDGPRPLAWSAWYPTEDTATKAAISEGSARSFFLTAEVVSDAHLASRQETYPVVLLSHGTGGTAAGLAWLSWRLAKAGFVVIGVDHHGNTASEQYRPEGFLCWWERARDLTVLLDHHTVEGQFAGRLDLDRTFAAGFSLGGYTVLSLLGAITDMTLFLDWAHDKPLGNGPREFPDLGEQVARLLETSAVFRASWNRKSLSYEDSRIKAALLCAPAPTVRGLTGESLSKIAVPVAIAAVGADIEAPSDLCAAWVHEQLPSSTMGLLDPMAGHYAFLCECSEWGKVRETEICADAPGVDRRWIHDRAAALAIELFSKTGPDF